MIGTANYIARKFGVRSAMPGFIAKKLCPDLVFVKGHFEKYKIASEIVRGVVQKYDPNCVLPSLDEVFIDLLPYVKRIYSNKNNKNKKEEEDSINHLTNIQQEEEEEIQVEEEYEEEGQMLVLEERRMEYFNLACEVVNEIRFQICQQTGGLTCSAGIATNFMLAKIGADQNKPDGQFPLLPIKSTILDFVHQLPVRKIGGIGKVSEKTLKAFDVHTVGDLAQSNKMTDLMFVLTPSFTSFLIRVSVGIGSHESEGKDDKDISFFGGTEDNVNLQDISSTTSSSSTSSSSTRKSIGRERTFSNENNSQMLISKCDELSWKVAADMIKKNVEGKTITIKLKSTQFEVITRATTSPNFISGFLMRYLIYIYEKR